jgi:predicted secreted protein
MKFTSIIAIYFLFFAGSAFILLPFGVRTTEDVGGEKIPGQAESAPHQFDIKRHLLKAVILGAVLFAIYYANWTFGWVTPDSLDFYNPPQSQQANS